MLTIFMPVVSVFGADQNMFDVYNLEISGTIYGFLTEDFNGDGLGDIATIYAPQSDYSTRYIGLYIYHEISGFQVRPDYLEQLPSSAAQFDAADYDDDGRAEIIFIDGDGVSSVSFNTNSGLEEPRRLIRRQTIYTYPLFEGVLTRPFALDINNSKGLEFIIPSARGYSVYERSEQGTYELLNNLKAPIFGRSLKKEVGEFTSMSGFNLVFNVPEIVVTDGNLDGYNDIYFLWNKRACTFFQDESGNFASTPEVSVDFFAPRESGFLQSKLMDFSGDRRPDLVAIKTSGGITNAETVIRCYRADVNGKLESRFCREIRLSDSHCNLILGDYNKDGSPELSLSAVELGALAMTKVFLMKKADLHLLIYPFNNGLPVDEPMRRIKYEFRFNFEDDQPTEEVLIDWSEDFNGDNICDLVFSDGMGKLKLYWGDDKNFLSKKTDLEMAVDNVAAIYPLHLGAQSHSDMIIEHEATGNYGRLTALVNKGNNLEGN
jgi:hypothetical protein